MLSRSYDPLIPDHPKERTMNNVSEPCPHPPASFHHEADPDPFLSSLACLADRTAISIPITLNIAGMFVTGDLASARDYFAAVGDEFANASPQFDSKTRDAIRAAFQPPPTTTDDPSQDTSPPPTHIYLKNATFALPGQPVPHTNRPIWWRGRLSCVQGFVLGRLGEP